MGHLVFALRLWACILWACVLGHCLLPQTVQAEGNVNADKDTLLGFRREAQQPAIWDTWDANDDTPCDWIGVSCTSDLQVQGLDFSGWGLVDPDPNFIEAVSWLVLLRSLQHLDLSSNQFSNVPDVSSLTGLTSLDLSRNQRLSLASTVYNTWDISAVNFNSLRILRYLNLAGSNFVGSIPELRNLTNLLSLDLSDNQLTGGIPNLEGLTSLAHLRLANNQLTGDIPNMEALSRLGNLNLGGNQFTGFREFGFRSKSLTYVDISRNKLEGRVPDGVGRMLNLQTLDLSWNTLRGPIPSGLGTVFHLDLSNNMLSGSIPQDIRDDSNWYSNVDLSANQLNGSIPAGLISAQCFSLNLSGNFLVGNIPEVGASRYLVALDLSNNLLDGPFPVSISNSFLHLRLGRNRLSGDIIEHLTTVLTNHTWRTRIWLDIRVEGNQFTGDIATLLPALRGSNSYHINNTLLRVLDLSYNSLNMTLPTAQDSNPLQVMLEDPHMDDLAELRLAGNSLMGISLPETLKRSLPSLRILDLSDSFLEGEITDELFTSMGNLTQFSVSRNNLSGGIPATLPRGLQVLDLSGNNLSGIIPPAIFVLLPNLTTFDVSNNRLSGRIPDGLPLNVFNASSFANNPGLCGGPLPDCPPERDQRRMRVWVLVTLVVAAALLLVSVASCLLLAWKWRGYSKKHEQDADLIAIVLKRALAVTLMPLRDLQRATNNFSESSLIGEGSGGTVHIGELRDGTKVAIKMCKHREGREGFAADKQQFLNEVEILSRVHHRHLVKLLGCCMESNKAALVFEYVPNGTLEEHVRGKKEGALSWKQRLLIALQTSDALAYLHSAADPPIFHTDVKSSNILLDEGLNAKVADFGISKLAPMGTSHVSTMGVQGTIGYIDPEYFHTLQLTAKSDVYSFGVVLLELISGKSPRDIMWGSEEASLVDLVFSVMRNGEWERLIDPCLLDILDTPAGKSSIHSTAALAAQCLAQTSPERPEMKEVRKQLQTIWVQYEVSFHHGTNLPSDIQGPESAQASCSHDLSCLLDFDSGMFCYTRTQSGGTGASDSVIEIVGVAESDPKPLHSSTLDGGL